MLVRPALSLRSEGDRSDPQMPPPQPQPQHPSSFYSGARHCALRRSRFESLLTSLLRDRYLYFLLLGCVWWDDSLCRRLRQNCINKKATCVRRGKWSVESLWGRRPPPVVLCRFFPRGLGHSESKTLAKEIGMHKYLTRLDTTRSTSQRQVVAFLRAFSFKLLYQSWTRRSRQGVAERGSIAPITAAFSLLLFPTHRGRYYLFIVQSSECSNSCRDGRCRQDPDPARESTRSQRLASGVWCARFWPAACTVASSSVIRWNSKHGPVHRREGKGRDRFPRCVPVDKYQRSMNPMTETPAGQARENISH